MRKGKKSRLFFILIVAMFIIGCSMEEEKQEKESLTRVEYIVSTKKPIIDETLIEGENEVVFAVTPEERAKYVPKAVWREIEQKADKEECSFKFISASEGMNENEIMRFLSGESTTVRMGKNDWFLLEMNAPYWLLELGATVKGKLTAIVTDRPMVKSYEEVNFSIPQIKMFDTPLLCKYLLVKATDDTGAELRYLYAAGKPVLMSQISRTMGDNPVVMDAKDLRNPLSVWRSPLKSSYYKLAESLLEGFDSLSNHQKMMVFMDYIADFYIGLSTEVVGVEEYIGECGSYSNLLAVFACTQGLPARIITLGNYPINTGHSVCEVFYNDGWHLYDPTYGAYYTTSSAEEVESPYVLGFEELTNGRGNDSDVVCVVTTPHRLKLKKFYGFLGPRIYEEADPKGVIGPNYPLIYPLAMEASSNGSVALTEKDFSTKYQGIEYIGAAGINNMQKWTLSGLEKGKKYDFVVTAESYNGDFPGTFLAKAVSTDASIMSGAERRFANEEPASMQWRITFIPSSDTAKILLTHDYRGPEFCFVRFSSFELCRTE